MARYRDNLPLPGDAVVLTDGGIETSLIYDQGIDLPDFAAFTLLDDEGGRHAQERYFDDYLAVAVSGGVGNMLNCAHPSHFATVLDPAAPWTQRLGGLRANASRLSHAELDEAEELDSGNPEELALEYVALRERLPRLTVLGGCCGTDHRHVDAMCEAWPTE